MATEFHDLKQYIQRHIFIILIMVVAFGLRFWEYWNLPFQHDELSALLRTYINGWDGFIETSVKRDNHPAGVQLLIWGLTASGGYSAWWIKLPFLLAGVWSIWLTYALANRLAGQSTALISAAILSSAQLHITYSQWARPYILGLCAVLVVAWLLVRIRASDDGRIKWYILLMIGIAAAAYTHYFALLQVILLVAISLYGLSRSKIIYVISASFLAALIFLPHLSVTLHHLNRGGIGEWLQPKDWDYGFEVIAYTANYSWWVGGLVLVLCISGMLRFNNHLSAVRLGLLILGILPYIIAFAYSRLVNPLLHQGVLFFSIPFFVLWMASFSEVKQPVIGFAAMFLLAVSSTAVVQDRLHYFINYQSEYETSIMWFDELNNKDEMKLGHLLDIRQDFTELYSDWGFVDEKELVFADSLWTRNSIQEYLDKQQMPYFFFAMTNATRPDLLAAVIDHYPCVEEVKHYHTGEAYLLSRRCDTRNLIEDKAVGDEYLNRESKAYSTNMDWTDSAWPDHKNLQLVASVRGEVENSVLVVTCSTINDSKTWSGIQFMDYLNKSYEIQRAYQSVYLNELDPETDRIKAYVWLNESPALHLIGFDAYYFPSNPFKGKLHRPFAKR